MTIDVERVPLSHRLSPFFYSPRTCYLSMENYSDGQQVRLNLVTTVRFLTAVCWVQSTWHTHNSVAENAQFWSSGRPYSGAVGSATCAALFCFPFTSLLRQRTETALSSYTSYFTWNSAI